MSGLKKPKNSNYAAVVVNISTLVELAGCDNVQAAIILGNQVIVGKDIKVGDIGLYFPLECQLSERYLSVNNLYRKAELNKDNTKKGYFEENGRIRCVKFRGHKSEGLFMPMDSINFCTTDHEEFTLGTEFDEINGTEICRKYIINVQRTPGAPGSKQQRKTKKTMSKLIDGQFRFHDDTSMLYKNLHRISPDSLISITYKLHGTSGISSYVLCKKKTSISSDTILWIGNYMIAPIVNFLGGDVKFTSDNTGYDYLYSSRKVIKNEELNPNAQHFYGVDIWGIADQHLRPFLQKGMTFYYEIVGYLPTGAMIQKDYDYGYKQPIPMNSDPSSLVYKEGEHYGIYLYRITYTNVDGKVFEFSAKQVQDFCKSKGLKAVPELYYGAPLNFMWLYGDMQEHDLENMDDFLKATKKEFNEKDCFMCKNKVPEEGCVVRIEGLDFEAYKQKSNAFYALETKLLDKGETNLEDEN